VFGLKDRTGSKVLSYCIRTDGDKVYTYQTQEKPYCQPKDMSTFVRGVLLPQNIRITSQNDESAKALQPVCFDNTSPFILDPRIPETSYVKSTLTANACGGAPALLLVGKDWVYLLFQKTCGVTAYEGGTALPGLGGWVLCNERSRSDNRSGIWVSLNDIVWVISCLLYCYCILQMPHA